MRKGLAALPYQAEIAVVMVIAFGLALADSIAALIHPTTAPPIDQHHLLALLVIEPVLAGLALGFLHLRGWRLEALGIRPNLLGIAEGIGLAFAAWFAYVLVYLFATTVAHVEVSQAALVAPHIAPAAIIAVSIVNPVFEETFVAGYPIGTLADRGRGWLGVNLSVGIRLAYHLYQGRLAVLSILPTGLVFALYYMRTRRLWPLFVAHAILDLIGLASAMH